MKKTALELRALVSSNAFELGRLTADQLGSADDYIALGKLYRNALDAMTTWASHDYAHTATTADSDAAFAACKDILALFTTEDSRIVMDQQSMRTIRDLSTKPKRLYSDEYRKATKAYKDALKQVEDRLADLNALGITAPKEDEWDNLTAWAENIPADVNRVLEGIDRVQALIGIVATVNTRARNIADIKAAGHWTWKRAVAVNEREFAELVENYIADCLDSGYNIKTSATVRKEAADAREARKAEKNNK